MKYYHRLDFQLAALFIIVFSSIVTLTGLLNKVSVQIWSYDKNPALAQQLQLTQPLFNDLSLNVNKQQFINQVQYLFNRQNVAKVAATNDKSTTARVNSFDPIIINSINQSSYYYLIVDQQLNIVIDNTNKFTQVELVRAEPTGNGYSVVTSNINDYQESFLIFNEVPAHVIQFNGTAQQSAASASKYLVLVIPNPINIVIPTVSQVVIKDFKTHLRIFGWYYLFIIIGIIGFLRFRLRPLRELELSAKSLTLGKIPNVIPLKLVSHDEVGQLVRAFNAAIEQLNENEIMRKRLIADISHELRTPLTNITGRIEAFEDGIIDNPNALIKFTSSQVNSLIKIIEDMDILTSTDSGELPLSLQEVRIIELLQQLLFNYNVDDSFVGSVHGQACTILIDPARFQQVINNLLDNALKAKPVGLVINIKIRSSANNVTVLFEDNGPGVAISHLPHLFERLYRVDDSRNNNTGGSGLGLAIVRNLIMAHQGSVECYINDLGGLGIKMDLPRR